MNLLLLVPVVVVGAALAVAAVTDVWKFKVYNVLTLPLLASGPVYQVFVGGQAGLLASLCGLLVGFAVLLPFHLLGGVGAGDVKLMAGVGAWLGAPFALGLFLVSSLAAGLYGLALVLITGKWCRPVASPASPTSESPAEAGDRVEEEVNRADRRLRIIPFAAMMAASMGIIVIWARVTA
jgi:prepilin peptidase CpaA